MTKLRQAAEQALKALEIATTHLPKDRQEVLEAMQAVRQALAEPPNSTTDVVEAEPIGYVYQNELEGMTAGLYSYCKVYPDESTGRIPLYTAPPKREWFGLTDEEIERDHYFPFYYRKFARAIEAKLREKNT